MPDIQAQLAMLDGLDSLTIMWPGHPDGWYVEAYSKRGYLNSGSGLTVLSALLNIAENIRSNHA